MRKKEYPHLYMIISDVTDIAPVNNEENQISVFEPKEPEAKATCIVKEYNEDEDDGNTEDEKRESLNLNLNINFENKIKPKVTAVALLKYNPEDDYTSSNDPYQKRRREGVTGKIDENTEKMIEDFKRDLELEKIQEEEKKAKQEKL